jgi:hypothetical protein
LGTLPIAEPKRVYKKRKPRRAVIDIVEPVEVPVMIPDEVEDVADPVVVLADENIDDD